MSHYDAVAHNYEELIAPKYAPIAAGVLEYAGLRPGDQVLEVAAGTGCLTVQAAPLLLPGGHLIATDAATAMIELAAEKYPLPGVTYGVANFRSLPFAAAQFDANTAVAR